MLEPEKPEREPVEELQLGLAVQHDLPQQRERKLAERPSQTLGAQSRHLVRLGAEPKGIVQQANFRTRPHHQENQFQFQEQGAEK